MQQIVLVQHGLPAPDALRF